jgi:type I restriction enzyme S subunit
VTTKKAAPGKPEDRFPTENSQSVTKPSPASHPLSTPPLAHTRERGRAGQPAGTAMTKGWQTKKLGEVLERTETVNPLLCPNTEFDYIDVSSVSNTTLKIEATQRLKGKDAPSRARKLVRTNDIIFATIRPTLKRIAVVPQHLNEQVCSTGYFVLRPKQGMDHRFVFYSLFTANFIRQMESLQKGASYPAVTDGDVKAQEIPVPPLAEQQRIVGLLDEAFAGLATAKAHAEQNLHNARALFESILDAAISGKVTGAWRESHPNIRPAAELLSRILGQRRAKWNGKGEYSYPAQAETESLPMLPSQWIYSTIEQLLRDDSGLSYGILKPGDPDPQGVPMIRVMDIGHGMLNDTEIFMVSKKLSDEFKRTILEEDDIMLAVMATVGRCAIVPPHLVGANVNRALAVLKLTKLVNVQFILFAILSPRIQALFQKNKIGAAQTRINLGDLRNYAIPLPPLPEQDAIVEILRTAFSATHRLARLYERKLAALEELKKSLLHQAFSGAL